MKKRVELVSYVEPDVYRDLCSFSIDVERRIPEILVDWICGFVMLRRQRAAAIAQNATVVPTPQAVSLWRSWWGTLVDVCRELFA